MRRTAVLIAAFMSCVAMTGDESPAPVAQVKFAWVKPDDPSIASVRRVGERTMDTLAYQFVSEVTRKLSSEATVDAIDAMHLKQVKLPASPAGGPVVIGFKLTSLKVRNPANAPDSADLAALDMFRDDLENGSTPPRLMVQHIEGKAGAPETWRLYKPIVTMPSCVKCHGDVDSLDPAVKEKLHRMYPDDEATGYPAHAWRGLFRITVEQPK